MSKHDIDIVKVVTEKDMAKLETAHINNCTVYHLPGRDWFYLLGPQNSQAKNLAFGLAEFPAGTLAVAHTHQAEEEIIYILSGEGAIISDGKETRLEPGLAVFIPPGLSHQIKVDGEAPLNLVTLFSPPVTPGAYDPDKEKSDKDQ
jgi:quercetin dioxygenase-like cupin family protein